MRAFLRLSTSYTFQCGRGRLSMLDEGPRASRLENLTDINVLRARCIPRMKMRMSL